MSGNAFISDKSGFRFRLGDIKVSFIDCYREARSAALYPVSIPVIFLFCFVFVLFFYVLALEPQTEMMLFLLMIFQRKITFDFFYVIGGKVCL